MEIALVFVVAYDPRKIGGRIATFQVIPLVMCFYYWAVISGFTKVESWPILLLATTGVIILYSMMMLFLVRAIRRPAVFSIDKHVLLWRPAFATVERRLAPGTIVSVIGDEVHVSPAFDDVPTTIVRDGHTIFKLPKGIVTPERQEFVI